MTKKLSPKFWLSVIIFSLFGQIAWVVENMYFNVYIYQEFNAASNDIALMVSLSAITATLTTLFMGALSDKIGKRKVFISAGYIVWGLSIIAFAFINNENLSRLGNGINALSLGISLIIVMDCVMTFFGSTANDAAFNAWITDSTTTSNRGRVEGINSIMPLIAILVVFGAFMGLTADRKWDLVFIIIGAIVIVAGILGIFIIKEPVVQREGNEQYFKNIFYGFRPSVIKENKTLYVLLGAYAIFGIVIQIFMPYLILYYQETLKMTDYVFIMAPAIIVAAVITALYGRVIDKIGFKKASVIALIVLIIGLMILFIFKNTVMVFIGSLFMMTGYLSGGAAFGAIVRDYTPENKVGLFQGIRMLAYVLIPMLVGPWIGSAVIKGGDLVLGDDGRYTEVPNSYIFLASAITTLLIFVVFIFLFKMLKPKKQQLDTDYQKELDPNEPLKEYPRPQLVRSSFKNLNGYWDFSISRAGSIDAIPLEFEQKIVVPFPIESKLSGVCTTINKGDICYYKKEFHLEKEFIKDRVILHFGAVDQIADIYLNGIHLLTHFNGYIPFEIDITDHIIDDNVLIVKVKDDLDKKYPYGKQTNNQGGMWYTKVTGIWQTVWIESVSDDYIKSLEITPLFDENKVKIKVDSTSTNKTIRVYGANNQVCFEENFKSSEVIVNLDNPINWTPENPFLYTFTITTDNDEVKSYFGFRKFSVCLVDGIKRLCLNNQPYFFNGLLDQGYFSDGIYTPATYQAFYDDILKMKQLGFNTLRKHIKIEPLVWYHLCDKLGMIVWQDMVNNFPYSFIKETALPTVFKKKISDEGIHKDQESRNIFKTSLTETIKLLYNVPSIALWTIFNEGWGQFDAKKVLEYTKELDDTRFIDHASGWFDQQVGEIQSLHIYFKPIKFSLDDRALIISEFGGYCYKITEHSFNIDKTFGYKFYKDRENFQNGFLKLYKEQVLPNISKGLCAAIYTQLSDVEDETNGILTYDRKVCKLDETIVKPLLDQLKI